MSKTKLIHVVSELYLPMLFVWPHTLPGVFVSLEVGLPSEMQVALI